MKRQTWWWMGLAAIALMTSLLMGNLWSGQSSAVTAATTLTAQAPSTAPEAPPLPAVVAPYEDPQGKFQVGILEGYTATAAAGSPLFYAGDGSLAYSVVRVPLSSNAPLSDLGLAEVVQRTFGKGEGFQTQAFSTIEGGLQINWTGRLTQGSSGSQPISGSILVRQQEADAYVLAVAALASGANAVPGVLTLLADTLVIL